MTNNVPRVVVSASGSGLRRALAPPPGIRLVCLLRRAAAALPCFLLLAPAAPRSVSSRLVSCLCLCLGLAVRRLPAVCRRVDTREELRQTARLRGAGRRSSLLSTEEFRRVAGVVYLQHQ